MMKMLKGETQSLTTQSPEGYARQACNYPHESK